MDNNYIENNDFSGGSKDWNEKISVPVLNHE